MHRQTKVTSILASVKAAVALRDCSGCILCGASGSPHCHVVRRSQGGLGVEQNIVTLCDPCHRAFDEGECLERLEPLGFHSRQDIKDFIYAYMKDHYPRWTPESVKYHKWEEERWLNTLSGK